MLDGHRWTIAAVAGFVTLVAGLASPALAQDDGSDEVAEDAASLVDALQAEIEAHLGRSVENLDDLVGEPGRFDLPPGEIAALAEAVVADALPDEGGSALTGACTGLAISFDGDGRIIDMASDFDDGGPPIDLLASDLSGDEPATVQAFTASNPFRVHVDGAVVYAGIAGDPGAGPSNHRWEIVTQGLSLDSGGDPNPEGKNRNIGSVDLGDQLPAPAKVSALFRIEGDLDADNMACAGHGYFETVGGAPVLGGVGLILFLGFGLGALFNARPAVTYSG